MRQQIVSFEELFPIVDKDGVYLCEDLHTSYWLEYGGGHKRKGTFIEYSKNFIDLLNAYHSKQRSLKVNYFTKSVNSIHYYDSIIVIEKKEMHPPFHENTGTASFPNTFVQRSLFQKIGYKVKRNLIKAINIILRWLKLPGFIWR